MTVLSPGEISDNSQIIDVRNPDEFLQEHIPGSRNIPMARLETQADQLKGQPVILTCRTGRRAMEAKAFLEAQGCTRVALLDGGLHGWKLIGMPTRSLRKGFSIMQQVQIIAGTMILTGFFIRLLWFLVPLAGFGLLTAGLTNTCMMASILSKMPWNRMPGNNLGSCSTGNCSL